MSNASDDELLLVLSTAPDRQTAERIGRTLVEEQLIACANLIPGLHSIYRWKGEVQAEPEVLILMKTRRGRFAALRERLPRLHPYQVPEVLALPVADGLDAYCRWVVEETRGDQK
jgi:periplasmic divalent cation tolerance protein